MTSIPENRGSALRSAGLSMLRVDTPTKDGKPAQVSTPSKVVEPLLSNVAGAADASPINGADGGRIVKRRGVAKALARRSTSGVVEQPELLASPPDQRVQLHRFSFGSIGPGIYDTQPVITRRHSITVSELPQLRNSCQDACFTLAFSPDGGQLAGGFFDGYLRIFDSQLGAEEFNVAIPPVANYASPTANPGVTSLSWMSDGPTPMLATTDAAGSACLWQLTENSRKPIECVWQTEGGASLSACCFTPDRNRLAVAGAGKVIRVYDIDEGAPAAILKPLKQDLGASVSVPGRLGGHSLKIVCLKADPTNPDVLYSAGIDRKVLRFDLRAGFDAVGQIAGPQLSGGAMDISSSGQQLLTGSHRADKPIQIFDLRQLSKKNSALTEALHTYSFHGDDKGKPSSCLLFGVAWDSEKNTTIAAAGQHENVAKCFRRRDDQEQVLHTVGKLEHSQNGFWSAAVAPDGTRVAYGSVDGSVHLAHFPPAFGYARIGSAVHEEDAESERIAEAKDP